MKREWIVTAAKDADRAPEAAAQIVLIADELRKQEVSRFSSQFTAQSASEKLRAQLQPIVAPFRDQFQPGTPLFQDVAMLHEQAVAAGMPDNEMTMGAAVILALAKSGKLSTAPGASASKEATQALNQALKGAAAAGSGAANTNAAPTPDFPKMSRQQFLDYKKSQGIGT